MPRNSARVGNKEQNNIYDTFALQRNYIISVSENLKKVERIGTYWYSSSKNTKFSHLAFETQRHMIYVIIIIFNIQIRGFKTHKNEIVYSKKYNRSNECSCSSILMPLSRYIHALFKYF